MSIKNRNVSLPATALVSVVLLVSVLTRKANQMSPDLANGE